MIHPTAIISERARIGQNVSIGQFTTIYDNVVIGDNTVIEGYCELGVSNHLSEGMDLIIGADSHIRSHSVFYEGSVFGASLVTGHRVTVREKVKAGVNLQIGTLGDIQGHCEIGNYVRFHSNVHIGQKSVIGDYVWIFPYVVLTNDPHPPSNILMGVTVHDYAVICTGSIVLPGVDIAKGSFIGAKSLVNRNTKEDMIYSGVPAKEFGPTSKMKLKDGTDRDAYPWRRHFERGYPEEIVAQWKKEFESSN